MNNAKAIREALETLESTELAALKDAVSKRKVACYQMVDSHWVPAIVDGEGRVIWEGTRRFFVDANAEDVAATELEKQRNVLGLVYGGESERAK